MHETSLENAKSLLLGSWIVKILWFLIATAASGDYENHALEICNIYWYRKDYIRPRIDNLWHAAVEFGKNQSLYL